MSYPMNTSVAQAVVYLTSPLSLIFPAQKIQKIQTFLLTALHTSYHPTCTLTLTLSPTAEPPRLISATCLAQTIEWAAWINLLGNHELELTLRPTTLTLKSQGELIQLWNAPRPAPLNLRSVSPDQSIIPISKFALKSSSISTLRPAAPVNVSGSDLKRTLTSSITRRTLAQLLIENDHEPERELFDLLSKSKIISPTPTRATFPTIPSFPPIPTLAPSPVSEESDSGSSRPSSRSSLFSSRSHSSEDSMSSLGSFNTPSVKVTPPTPTSAPVFRPRRTAPAPAPAPAAAQEKVYIDKSRKHVQAYLYQGGKSTVLTGGVMLGAPSSGVPPPLPSQSRSTGHQRGGTQPGLLPTRAGGGLLSLVFNLLHFKMSYEEDEIK
ncbi:hypothetical protein BDQ17DRAFT_1409357 [Cyathus striatus]|nr:hypothetical protein BDQ17DRAFT_1409357 [Cyathus striatus]